MARRRIGATLRRRLDSQDVVQEALLRAFRLYLDPRRRPGDDAGSFLPWLAAVIENTTRGLARFHVRAARRSVLRDSPATFDVRTLSYESDASDGDASERRDVVRRAMKRLTPRQREVVDLVYLEGLPVRDAAKRMGKSANSTSVLLFEALERLGAALETDGARLGRAR